MLNHPVHWKQKTTDCAECEIKKTKFISSKKGSGILNSLGDTAAELAITKGIPWLGKTAVEIEKSKVTEKIH